MGVLAATGDGVGVGGDDKVPISKSSASSPMNTSSYSSLMEEEGGVMKRFMWFRARPNEVVRSEK
jgi:hypothetical protein